MLKGVLDGIRIIDLSRVWSGPMAVRMLADMGAEVILIDAPGARLKDRQFLEMMKRRHAEGRHFPYYPDGDPGDEPWNRQGSYNDFNRNKLGITLNLADEKGCELFKRLVKISDIVVENFTPRVMKNFGLDYPVLSQSNPRLIMMSLPGYGMYGSYRDYPAYGTTLEQHAGFSSVMGYPDSGPYRTQSTYADPVSSVNGAGAMMLALYHRRKTGQGQYIDLAQIESSICMLGQYVLDYSMNQRNPQRLGNGHAWMAPHGCYRCKGADKWVSIAVANDEEWRALRRTIGDPPWANDARFANQLGRWENQLEMDKLIQVWTILHGHHEVMNNLQAAGVTAGAVLDAHELLDDPQLTDRGYFVRQEHHAVGMRPYPGLPIKYSRTPPQYLRPAPSVDEHQDYVFGDLLGLSKNEIVSLYEAGIIGNKMKDSSLA